MSIIEQLSSSLGRKDEEPNVELARVIAAQCDADAVEELVENLQNKDKEIQSNCIKVLYEIGALQPSLLVPHTTTFLALLRHKNNRLQWGAMTALCTIVLEHPEPIYTSLNAIVDAANSGSVITKDNAVKILIALCAHPRYADTAFALFNEQLLQSPVNQLPMYAELALPVINAGNKQLFVTTLTSRLDDIEKESKRKRVEKVITKVQRS